jgi:cytochrome c553
MDTSGVRRGADGGVGNGLRMGRQCDGGQGKSQGVRGLPRCRRQQRERGFSEALQGYKSGTRKNPIMAPMGTNLSQRDIEDLAAYFSAQQGLVTFK